MNAWQQRVHGRRLEGEACALVVGLGGGDKARAAAARALRFWRSIGDRERARWFRRHVTYITGHLWKSAQMRAATEAVAEAMRCPECERSNGPHYRGPCVH